MSSKAASGPATAKSPSTSTQPAKRAAPANPVAASAKSAAGYDAGRAALSPDSGKEFAGIKPASGFTALGAGGAGEKKVAPAKAAAQAFREAKREHRKSARTDAAIARDEAGGKSAAPKPGPAGVVPREPAPSQPDEPMAPYERLAVRARKQFNELHNKMRAHMHVADSSVSGTPVQLALMPAIGLPEHDLGLLAWQINGHFSSLAEVLAKHMHPSVRGNMLVGGTPDPRLWVPIHATEAAEFEAACEARFEIAREALAGHTHHSSTGQASSPPTGTPAYEAWQNAQHA